MSENDILSCKDVFNYGSHTVSHSNLKKLDDIQISYELKKSKIEIEKILKEKINTIAYPYGFYNVKRG